MRLGPSRWKKCHAPEPRLMSNRGLRGCRKPDPERRTARRTFLLAQSATMRREDTRDRGKRQRSADFVQPALRRRTAYFFQNCLYGTRGRAYAFAGYSDLRTVLSCSHRNMHGAAGLETLQLISDERADCLCAALAVKFDH